MGINCSLGITAYNEEANIGRLLEAALRQETGYCRLQEIFVVASGCTDRTVEIAQSYARRYPQVRVLEQAERQGKASAINLFLQHAQGEIFIIESADTIPAADAYENLVAPFADSQVGMTGAHPVPVNSAKNFMGHCAHFLWGLHHRMALRHPKLGETIAFRSIVRSIPANTAVDEVSIEMLVTRAGYKLAYAPRAIVYNKGPETVRDFIKQRRRIGNGHLQVKLTTGYAPSTSGLGATFNVIGQAAARQLRRTAKIFRKGKPLLGIRLLARQFKYAVWSLGTIGLEAAGRLLGWYDCVFRRRNPVRWEPITTTKNLGKC